MLSSQPSEPGKSIKSQSGSVPIDDLLSSQLGHLKLWSDQATKSCLVNTGAPIEYNFISDGCGPRLTIEATGPEINPVDRGPAAIALAAQLSAPINTTVLLKAVLSAQKQTTRPLEYGAWLGLRLVAEDLVSKLYLEFPSTAERRLLPKSAQNWLGLQPCMLGFRSDNSDVEIYFKGAPQTIGGVTGLLNECGQNGYHNAQAIFTALNTADSRIGNNYLDGPDAAVSVVFNSNNEIQTVCWLLYAFSLFGPDHKIRQAISRLFNYLDRDPTAYQRFTRPFMLQHPKVLHHGIIGLSTTKQGLNGMQIGLSRPTLPSNDFEKE